MFVGDGGSPVSPIMRGVYIERQPIVVFESIWFYAEPMIDNSYTVVFANPSPCIAPDKFCASENASTPREKTDVSKEAIRNLRTYAQRVRCGAWPPRPCHSEFDVRPIQ